jgi:hypothetical protein
MVAHNVGGAVGRTQAGTVLEGAHPVVDRGHVVDLKQRRGVAVQVAFVKSKGLKPFFHFTGSRVGSPGAFTLLVNCIQLVQPHLRHVLPLARRRHDEVAVLAARRDFPRQSHAKGGADEQRADGAGYRLLDHLDLLVLQVRVHGEAEAGLVRLLIAVSFVKRREETNNATKKKRVMNLEWKRKEEVWMFGESAVLGWVEGWVGFSRCRSRTRPHGS